MSTIPVVNHISDPARVEGEIKADLEAIVASLRQVPGAGQTDLTATISGGSITPAGVGGVIVIDTEAAAATDDLANIITTNYPDGSMILIRNANAARLVVVKSLAGGAGQMNLDRVADYTLDDTKKWLLLKRTGSDWFEIMRGPQRMIAPVLAKSSTYTVAKEDIGKVIACTGTFTVNLLSAASAGNGFVVSVRNMSTGTITIDPNSAELIDGLATLILAPGYGTMMSCDASAWTSIVPTPMLSQNNPIINGSMDVWQRGTAFVGVGTSSYSADRWKFNFGGSGILNINRSTNVPSVAQAGVLFNYSLEHDVTTADASIAAGDVYLASHIIEGYNWRQLAQRIITLSFWVSSSKTGIHCVAFRNNLAGTPDRSYVAEYTINVADTWEYKTITVPASPSGGTWDYTTGAGLGIAFSLAIGSTFQTTAGTWQTGNFVATANQVNVMDSASNFFRLTGVKLELGSVATPIQYVPFEQELSRAQRYYQKSFQYANTPNQNVDVTTAIRFFSGTAGAVAIQSPTFLFRIFMRAAPAVTVYNPSAANAQLRNQTDGADLSATSATGWDQGFTLASTGTAGTAIGESLIFHWTVDAEF